jgi:hypothetical protein
LFGNKGMNNEITREDFSPNRRYNTHANKGCDEEKQTFGVGYGGTY